jgi:hypothetical protein
VSRARRILDSVARAAAGIPSPGDAAALALCCSLAVVVWLPRLEGPIDLRWDGGAYYALGTSLFEGRGYRILSEPGAPRSILHPPLLPAIVAANQLIAGTSDPAIVGHRLRLLFLALFVLYTGVAYLLFRTSLPVSLAVLAALLCLLNERTCFYSDLCYPEIPFGVATLGCLLAARRTSGPLPWLCGVVAYSLRTMGAALLAAWTVEALLNRRPRTAALRLLLAATPVLGWQAYIASVTSSWQHETAAYAYQHADYVYYNVGYGRNLRLVDPFRPDLGYATASDLGARLLANLARMPMALGEATTSTTEYWSRRLPYLGRVLPELRLPGIASAAFVAGLSLLMALGVAVQIRRGQWLVPLYVVAYVALVSATPWSSQLSRYLTPLAPVLTLCLFVALVTIRERLARVLPTRWKAASVSIFVIVLLPALTQASTALYWLFRDSHQIVPPLPGRARTPYRLFFYGPDYRDLDEGLLWLQRNASSSEIVATSDPFWVHVNTGLRAVLPPLEIDEGEAQRLLDSVPVRYLLLDETTAVPIRERFVEPVISKNRGAWSLAFSTDRGGVQIYERERPRGAGSVLAGSGQEAPP